MVSKILVLSAVIAYVEARFGQEQIPISAISAVNGGAPGAAATIAGAAISDLLGAANSCDKLVRADQIVSELGGGADAIAAAIGMVTAEKNTNPFANNNIQNVCADPGLPATPELRGITPLIDPAVDVDGAVAALSAQTAASPLNADGLSVFDLLDQAGFGNLVAAQQPAGGAAAGGAAEGGNNANANAGQDQNQDAGNANDNAGQDQNQDTGNANDNAGQDQNQNDNASCDAGNAAADNSTANSGADASADAGSAADNSTAATGGAAAGGASTIAGADFGKCTPTIIFEAGQPGRKPDEFTFQIADPVARGGQQDALNPNIITNALCNQLINVCGANDAAQAACQDGKAKVAAAGTRDKSTADLFNAAVGFAGAVTNPDGGPEDVPAAAKRVVRMRSFRY